MEQILANLSVSVTELKRNFSQILSELDEQAIAVLNHNKPEAYLISASYYVKLLQGYEDALDCKVVQERANGPFVELSLDEL